MISDQLLKVEETDLNFSTLKNEKLNRTGFVGDFFI